MTQNNFQGSYEDRLPLGYAGLIATANARDAYTYTLEGDNAAFGLACGQGTADRGAVLGGGDFVGVTIADKSLDQNTYQSGDSASLLRKGVMWVIASTDVSPADPVTYDANGQFGAGLASPLPDARFEATVAAGGLVRLALN